MVGLFVYLGFDPGAEVGTASLILYPNVNQYEIVRLSGTDKFPSKETDRM